jgi:hypothetical protein
MFMYMCMLLVELPFHMSVNSACHSPTIRECDSPLYKYIFRARLGLGVIYNVISNLFPSAVFCSLERESRVHVLAAIYVRSDT